MPAISVIVPVYKAESFLGKCVDSVLSQTMADIELILVDDGSPDKSEICDSYALADERVRVIHRDNGVAPRATTVSRRQVATTSFCRQRRLYRQYDAKSSFALKSQGRIRRPAHILIFSRRGSSPEPFSCRQMSTGEKITDGIVRPLLKQGRSRFQRLYLALPSAAPL